MLVNTTHALLEVCCYYASQHYTCFIRSMLFVC